MNKSLECNKIERVDTRVYKMPYGLYTSYDGLGNKDTIEVVFTNGKLSAVRTNYFGNPSERVKWIVNEAIIEEVKILEKEYTAP